jgi:2-polyprenyl-3-methyl-5-hydroxy-6-metoxy-1,4-benzoquinol methylase
VYPFFLKYLGKNNLDYGCGIGDFLSFCKFFNKKIRGCDVNINLVNFCSNRGFKAFLLGLKKPNKNFKNLSYDCIVMDNVLEHIEDPKTQLLKISGSIKKDGYLVVGIPIGRAGFDHDPDHKKYYNEADLDKLITAYGFVNINSFYRPFKSNYLRNNLKQYCYFAIYQKVKR